MSNTLKANLIKASHDLLQVRETCTRIDQICDRIRSLDSAEKNAPKTLRSSGVTK